MTDRDAVLRKIELANEAINDSYGEALSTPDHKVAEAIRALAQSNLAVAYATLMVAENQPLGVLGDVVTELRRINADGIRVWQT